jgi:hypothetical protein
MNGKVKGFLHAGDGVFLNGENEPILLRGVGLGNWLLPEGYMWRFPGNRADRPHRIKRLIMELCGEPYAREFFERFAEGYITEGDIARIAREGYNSVRVPFTWRVLMKEGPGVEFLESGFALLDKCIDLCEKYGLYVFLDMHGAPGGQTGSNIDDCVDDVPRLFLDRDSWDKAQALWEELARRYRDRWIVGGYDLLNEPLHTPGKDGLMPNVDFLIPALRRFYEECIARIRKVDQKHLFSLEGPHWSTDISIFDQEYDPNMCVHFHRYWNAPAMELLAPYLALREKNHLPLWLGETGENTIAWFAAMFPLLEENGISWNFWPWKKMDCANSPCSIRRPRDWDKVLGYISGGPHPGFEKAQGVFEEYLHNMRFENTDYHSEVVSAMMRRADTVVPGIQHDLAGSFGGRRMNKPGALPEVQTSPGSSGGGRTDHPWLVYGLQLSTGEHAAYTIHLGDMPARVLLRLMVLEEGTLLRVGYSDGAVEIGLEKSTDLETLPALVLPEGQGEAYQVVIACQTGSVLLDEVIFETISEAKAK